jgi:hypothetical protein
LKINRLHFFIAIICLTAAIPLSSAAARGDDRETPPARTAELRQNSPNPFNPHTVIGYYLPGACRVRLEVFDAAGRSVKVLVDGTQPAGEHEVNWDGRDSRGVMSASGVYFYRLTAGRTALIRKMILLK